MVECLGCGAIIEGEPVFLGEEPFHEDCIEEYFVCESCGATIHQDFEISTDSGEVVCSSCCRSCEWCERVVLNSETTHFNGDYVCERCYEDDTFTCDSCGDRRHIDDYGEDGYCQSCIHENDEDLDSPDTDIEPTTITSKTFKENTSKRYIGIEIEAEDGKRRDVLEWFNKEPKHFVWSMVYDGSLNNGVEFVSPKMNGDRAYEEIRNICRAAKYADFKISSRCGLHVHFDFSDSTEKEIKKIALAYALYDPFFMRMLPKSRQNNHYCIRMLSHYSTLFSELNSGLDRGVYDSNDKEYLSRCKNSKYCEARYGTLNLHSYYLRGSLEVRTHGGTLSPTKIINWIEIHNNFFKWVLSKDMKFFLRHVPTLKSWRNIVQDKELIEYYQERVKEFSEQPRKEFVQQVYIRAKKLYRGEVGREKTYTLMKMFDKDKKQEETKQTTAEIDLEAIRERVNAYFLYP